MKTNNFIELILASVCVVGVSFLCSCQQEIVDPCEETTNSKILRFKEVCYNDSGEVIFDHLEGDGATEWNVAVETDDEVYRFYELLTGLQVCPDSKYEYSYHTDDLRYVSRIIGQVEPHEGKYASLFVEVEGCPEISVIHFITYSYRNARIGM